MLRLLVSPRWLLRHVLALLLIAGCCVAARWQFLRALHRHSLLNASYTLEWSLFAGFVVLCWAWFLRDELRGPDVEPVAVPLPASSVPVLPRAAVAPETGADDPELAAYNAYLAGLDATSGR